MEAYDKTYLTIEKHSNIKETHWTRHLIKGLFKYHVI